MLYSKSELGPAFGPKSYEIKTSAHDQLSPLPRLPERVLCAAANTLLAPALSTSLGLLQVYRSPPKPNMGPGAEEPYSIFVKNSQPSKSKVGWKATCCRGSFGWTGSGSRPTASLEESGGREL